MKPPIQLNDCLKSSKKLRKQLKRYGDELPNKDAYSTVYCVVSDCVKSIDYLIKNINSFKKEADKDLKKNPKQAPNRAKKWCKIK